MTDNYNYPPDDASDATSEADRRWFEEHPDRATWLRPLTDGDLKGDGVNAIIVFCPVDGFRLRIAIECVPGTSAYEWLHGAAHEDGDLIPTALDGVRGVMGDGFASRCIDALLAFRAAGRRPSKFLPQGGTA